MDKLAECNTENCHRGIERGTVQDGDLIKHRVRVSCARCGVETDWQVDDSVDRAVADWNASHVERAVQVFEEARGRAAADARATAQTNLEQLERFLPQAEAEAAHADLKAGELAKAGKTREANTFKAMADEWRAHATRTRGEIAQLRDRTTAG